MKNDPLHNSFGISLAVINGLLQGMKIQAINEQTAREWFIEGGETFEELANMANCYAGEIEQSKITASYHSNSRYL